MDNIKVLIEKEKVKARIEELGKQITKDYNGEEIVVLPILRGAMFFAVDLAREINLPMTFDFMKLSSYGSARETSGEVKIIQDSSTNLKGKNVLVVEDIIDSGYTMHFLKKYLQNKEVKSAKIVALLNKSARREVEVNIDYIGFEVPNKYIVGYGLDDKEYYRNLPYVGYIE